MNGQKIILHTRKMYKENKIAVVIPAYNEGKLIELTLNGIPEFVDIVFVVHDGSTDDTYERILKLQGIQKRIIVINHETNKGLGQSLIDGYLTSKESDADITVIMAGDNQMDPNDLPNLLDRIIDEGFDYVKGNRLLHSEVKTSMPRYRLIGNAILTILTKFATGYFFLMDPQSGYTAIKNSVLKKIPIEKMTKGYGYNADILCMLNIQGFKVTDQEIRPVYGDEKSKIKLLKYIFKSTFLLIRLFFRRLWRRYVILDFHPLILFYLFSIFNIIAIIIPLIVRFFVLYKSEGEAPKTTLIILVFTTLITFQSVLFAIWMDMDYNKRKS
ncbi:MAG: glycosyltransferase family 2 protein [Candidatus Atribacteria bacterium]|nr:glycosyltransferase family 2 protein [Candidatus Atribacteria bacterium]